ncbi:MAG: hypothetical protein Q8P75_01115 [bacterium]|nr:hypothetical protein [bacterium]MDZ4341710.1 hypothetical protein [Candidatus Binatia bacterium]
MRNFFWLFWWLLPVYILLLLLAAGICRYLDKIKTEARDLAWEWQITRIEAVHNRAGRPVGNLRVELQSLNCATRKTVIFHRSHPDYQRFLSCEKYAIVQFHFTERPIQKVFRGSVCAYLALLE